MFSVKFINVFKIFAIGLTGIIVGASAETVTNYAIQNQMAIVKGLSQLIIYCAILSACLTGYLVYRIIQSRIKLNLRLEETKEEALKALLESIDKEQKKISRFDWSNVTVASIFYLIGTISGTMIILFGGK